MSPKWTGIELYTDILIEELVIKLREDGIENPKIGDAGVFKEDSDKKEVFHVIIDILPEHLSYGAIVEFPLIDGDRDKFTTEFCSLGMKKLYKEFNLGEL